MEERGRRALLDVLKAVRSEAGLTQAELARRLGVPQSFVSKYENGERRLDLLEARKVCHALGTSLVDVAQRLEDALGEKTAGRKSER